MTSNDPRHVPEDVAPRRSARELAVPLLLCCAVGTALRLAAAWHRVLLGDEVGTAYLTGRSLLEIVSEYGDWQTQPAYLIAAKISTLLFGTSELSLRIPSLLFGILFLPLVFLLGRRLLDARIGLLAAWVAALLPFHVFHSQNARGYSMATTLALAATILWVELQDRGKKRSRGQGMLLGAMYAICIALALYTHLGCTGLLPAHAVAGLVVWQGQERRSVRDLALRSVLPLSAGMIAAALLYLPMASDMIEFKKGWAGEGQGGFSLGFLPLLLSAYSGGRGISVYVTVVVAGVGLWRCFRKSRATGILLVTWPLGVLVFYGVNQTAHYAWAYARFFLVALPALVIPLATGLATGIDVLTRRRTGFRRIIPASLILLTFFLVVSARLTDLCFGTRDTAWPSVLTVIRNQVPRPHIVYPVPIRFNSFLYYAGEATGGDLSAFVSPQILTRILVESAARAPSRPLPRIVTVVDLVPFDGERWSEFEIRRFGITTLLWRREASPPRQAAADICAITGHILAFLEAHDTDEITEDWVYWKIHDKQDNMFLCKEEIPRHRRVLDELAPLRGESASNAPPAVTRRPGEVRASWSMLLPHVDFLDWLVPRREPGASFPSGG